jgi:hypothetical protein
MIIADRDRLRSLNRELVKALELAVRNYSPHSHTLGDYCTYAQYKTALAMRAALAKAKEG